MLCSSKKQEIVEKNRPKEEENSFTKKKKIYKIKKNKRGKRGKTKSKRTKKKNKGRSKKR